MKPVIIYLISLVLISCSVNRNKDTDTYAINRPVYRLDKNICCCKYFSEDNSRFWKLDSTCANGFRRIIAPLILKECDLLKIHWKDVSIFFGNPKSFNLYEYVGGKEAIRLTYYTYIDWQSEDPMNSFKTQFLDIVIDKKDSIILKANIRYVDG